MPFRIVLSAALLACLWSTAHAETLSGVVLQQNGKPAPGAKICVATVFQHPPLRSTVMTDEHGAFRVELIKDRQYHLAVRWQTGGIDVTEGVDSNGKSVRLSGQKLPPQVVRLHPGGTLRGKLLRSEDDGPIACARLFLDTGEILSTDQQGVFTVSGLPMTNHSLIPVAKGRVRQYVLFDTTRRTNAELELRLPRGARLKGRIIDEEGKTIPGAFLRRNSSGGDSTLNGWDEVCAADGSFEYSLSTQRLFYGLQAEAPGYRDQEVTTQVDNPETVVERTVRLHKETASQSNPVNVVNAVASAKESAKSQTPVTTLPRRTVRGFVRDGDGDRITGAKVRWAGDLWDSSVKPTTTDAEGKYRLPGVPAGQGALLVIADSYAPQFVPIQAEQENLDVRLSRGTTVRGIVNGNSGKPVAGVRIIPVTQCLSTGVGNPIWLDERSTRTDEKGEFKIAAVPRDGVRFDFLKEGYSDQRNVELLTEDAPNKIELKAGGAISGNVVDSKGEPVRNFKIRVMLPRNYKPGELTEGYYAGYEWYGASYTHPEGFFIFTGLGANSWVRLVVTSPGTGRAIVDRARSEPLDRLSQEENRTIRLRPFAPLAVRVVEAGTKGPITKGTAALVEDFPNFANGFSWGYDDLWSEQRKIESAGKAEFAEPGCEDGTIIVRAPGFARERIGWTNGAREVTVAVEPEAVIRGEVRFKGRRLTEGLARLTSSAKDQFTIDLEDSQGEFNFDQLPAGDYELVISHGQGQSLAKRKLSLTPGKVHVENITISENGAAK